MKCITYLVQWYSISSDIGRTDQNMDFVPSSAGGEWGVYDIPSYQVSQTRNVNTLQLLACLSYHWP
jgi:hypothetical protein